MLPVPPAEARGAGPSSPQTDLSTKEREERGKGAWIHFVFVYSDFKYENTACILSYPKVSIAQLKSLLHLVKYASIKLGAGGISS